MPARESNAITDIKNKQNTLKSINKDNVIEINMPRQHHNNNLPST